MTSLLFLSGQHNAAEHYLMESESGLLATSYDVDGASSVDESQRDEGSSSSVSKDSVLLLSRLKILWNFCVCK